MNFLLRFLLSATVAYYVALLQPGREERDQLGTLVAAVAIALFTSFLKPQKIVRRLPITIVTLALIVVAVNTGLLLLCNRYIPGFELPGWKSALLVAACATVVSLLIDRFVRSE
ncbi:MAG: phage holin family protein [Chitinophagaceae bacterium]|nr:MAG: phage holin family protein [Chitinophagaceae bacterium]